MLLFRRGIVGELLARRKRSPSSRSTVVLTPLAAAKRICVHTPGHLARTALLDWLFRDLRKHRVFASVDPRNDRSIALMHRLHFRQEAHFRESLYIEGVDGRPGVRDAAA